MLEQFLSAKRKLIELNDVQRQAVSHIEGPLLLLASPGSGKTTTMIMRLGYMLSCCNVSSDRVIAVSFSKASAADMGRRYAQLFPELPQVKFSTIHSLAYDIVRTQLQLERRSYRMIDGFESEQGEHETQSALQHEGMAEANISKHQLLRTLFEQVNGTQPKEEQMEELKTYISYVKNKQLPVEQWDTASCSIRHAAQIAQLYEQKKEHGYSELLLDFDDMLVYAEQFLSKHESLRQRYKSRYDYVVSDESQDTSLVQHRILRWLVEDHLNLCVVADDDQSIYSWRGAEPAYLLAFQQHYPSAKILYMEQNYRSSRTIVEVANQFIKRNRHRYEKSMFTENEHAQPIVVKHHAHIQEEIAELVQQLKHVEKLEETAVLYRNHSSSLLLMHELDKQGIPFYMKDADDRFFKHWIVEDILNFMRLSYTDRRFELFEKVMFKMNVYVTKQQILELKSKHTDQSLFQLLLEETTLKSYQIERIQEAKAHIDHLKSMTPKEAIHKIRHDLGYDKCLDQIAERLGFQKERLLLVLNNVEVIAEGLSTLEQFAGRLKDLEKLQHQARRRSQQKPAVTLSTLHSAKGLEFDTVFMIDLAAAVIPSRQELSKPELIEEAARLFYVGLTRARKRLELHSVANWQGSKSQPSIFVEEVQRIINPVDASVPEHLHVAGKVTVKSGLAGKGTGQADKADSNRLAAEQQWRQSGESLLTASELGIGMNVEHLHFGKGIIEHLEQDKLSIVFEQYGTKTIAASVVLQRGLLRLRTEATILT
ncbi:ATP-dependent helicase [Paenibacillus septentrionalis]|uniref:DNA 3'-5' helicase n=1 Tax=Paenibacillus septentrionalis TaxID=429342 RepID=A0ABW1V017_9BACL